MPTADSEDVTALLLAWREGDIRARDRLVPLVYDELHRRAVRQLRGERPGHTLRPTALVHEAYLRLLDLDRVEWKSRAHFLAVASQTMRRVLVDHARSRLAAKRVPGEVRITLDDDVAAEDAGILEVIAVDQLLTRLGRLSQRHAAIVELRFFGGLSLEETAEAVGVSPRTVKREWRLARAWLYRNLAEPSADGRDGP